MLHIADCGVYGRTIITEMVLLLVSSLQISPLRTLQDDLFIKRIIGVLLKTRKMKLRFKKRNSPRLQSAINRTFHSWVGYWWIRSDVRALGMWCLDIAYGADKYDVLNKLCCPCKRSIVSFVRCDIRHRTRLLDLLLLLLLLTYLWLMSQPLLLIVSTTI